MVVPPLGLCVDDVTQKRAAEEAEKAAEKVQQEYHEMNGEGH